MSKSDNKNILLKFWNLFWDIQKNKSISLIQSEACELEILFFLYVFMPFFGYPVPYSIISIDLLPYVIKEIDQILLRESRNIDKLSKVISIFDGI